MDLNQLIKQQDSKRVRVTPEVFFDFRARYAALYRGQMLDLYDKHYIECPTLLEQNNWTSIFQEEGIRPLTWDGSIPLRPSHIQLLLLTQEEQGEEPSEFLLTLYRLLTFRKEVEAIDKLYDILTEKKNSQPYFNMSIRMYMAGGVVVSRYFGSEWTEGTISVFLKKMGQVGNYPLDQIFFSLVRDYLGMLPEEPIFETISPSLEKGLIPEFFDEAVRKSPNFRNALQKKFPGQSHEDMRNNLITDTSMQLHRATSKFVNKLHEEGKEILAVSKTAVFYSDSEEEVLYTPAGYVSKLLDEDFASPETSFLVATGDYISEKEVEDFGGAKGVPVEIDGELYYDNEQMNEPLVPFLKQSNSSLEITPGLTYSNELEEGSLESYLDRARVDLETGESFLTFVPVSSLQQMKKAAARVVKATGW